MNINEKRYPNISKAVAFRIAFTNVLCGYGNVGFDEIEKEICSLCGYSEQIANFLVPKSAIKKILNFRILIWQYKILHLMV